MQRKCGECRWWDGGADSMGLCRAGYEQGQRGYAVFQSVLGSESCGRFTPIECGTCADCRWFTPDVCHIDPLSRQVIPAHWCARFDLR